MSLLGMAPIDAMPPIQKRATVPLSVGTPAVTSTTAQTGAQGRPLSVVELMQQKNPATNTQKLALFAYYREKVEGLSRFSKADLRTYFGRARVEARHAGAVIGAPARLLRDGARQVVARQHRLGTP
jgi:hypothetical protein